MIHRRGLRHPQSAWFQSTRPRGARRVASVSSSAPVEFQSTRPRGARPSIHEPYSSMADRQFQSTRPRGARPARRGDAYRHHGVSIHAPAWGATRANIDDGHQLKRFNPRARVGRDVQHDSAYGRPTRFNPRARVGRDGPRATLGVVRNAFQSTRPRGARRATTGSCCQLHRVSIHAPAWGATRCDQRRLMRCIGVSIHAPARGATSRCNVRFHQRVHVSIHAPAWGAT